jgi:hypothetical protein
MNCLTSYCYCANFGNPQAGKFSKSFEVRFALSTAKAVNHAFNEINHLLYIRAGILTIENYIARSYILFGNSVGTLRQKLISVVRVYRRLYGQSARYVE